jgi:hypothetical protein
MPCPPSAVHLSRSGRDDCIELNGALRVHCHDTVEFDSELASPSQLPVPPGHTAPWTAPQLLTPTGPTGTGTGMIIKPESPDYAASGYAGWSRLGLPLKCQGPPLRHPLLRLCNRHAPARRGSGPGHCGLGAAAPSESHRRLWPKRRLHHCQWPTGRSFLFLLLFLGPAIWRGGCASPCALPSLGASVSTSSSLSLAGSLSPKPSLSFSGAPSPSGSPTPTPGVPSAQRVALQQLYSATSGQGWVSSQGWLTGDPCVGAWFGVGCSSDHHAVTYVCQGRGSCCASQWLMRGSGHWQGG